MKTKISLVILIMIHYKVGILLVLKKRKYIYATILLGYNRFNFIS
jgi:hypothetical protein